MYIYTYLIRQLPLGTGDMHGLYIYYIHSPPIWAALHHIGSRARLASCTPCMGTRFVSPSAFFEPSCMCAERGCMHTWLGSVYALYGYTFNSASAFLRPSCTCAERGCMHAFSGFVYALYGDTFNSPPTSSQPSCMCAEPPTEAACMLGLASCTPCMATRSGSPPSFSEPRCMCAERGCMRAWPGFMYMYIVWLRIQLSSYIF
jgi:hypothetical protein